jgi:hypothetical protein
MKVVQFSAPAAFTPRKYFWYSFLLDTESTPGPYCHQKDYVNEILQWHHRESNLRPSGLYRSASTNYATAYPTQLHILTYNFCDKHNRFCQNQVISRPKYNRKAVFISKTAYSSGFTLNNLDDEVA